MRFRLGDIPLVFCVELRNAAPGRLHAHPALLQETGDSREFGCEVVAETFVPDFETSLRTHDGEVVEDIPLGVIDLFADLIDVMLSLDEVVFSRAEAPPDLFNR